MGILIEENRPLKCAQCNQTLKRNKKLNLTFCPTCGLTRYNLEPPQHIIITTQNKKKEKQE